MPRARPSLTYSELKVWDAEGRNLTARFLVERDGVRLIVDASGARYPVTVDPIAQQAYLKASNTDAGDQFGLSVAVSGDTVVVGAYGEDSNATGINGDQSDNSASHSGAAYVFVRNGTNWTQQAYLKASNTDAGDVFGYSVAVSGDTVVVGASERTATRPGSTATRAITARSAAGAAYVFVRNGTTGPSRLISKLPTPSAGDRFGHSVAVSGDTVVVGALGEDSNATGVNGNQSDNSATDAGAAYVFVRNGTNWTQQAYLKASNTEAGDEFGYLGGGLGRHRGGRGMFEDSNATGINGNQTDNSARRLRRGLRFRAQRDELDPASLSQSFQHRTPSDQFGSSVAVSGDTVVVGAY